MRKWQGFLVSILIISLDVSSKYFISKMLIPYYPQKIAPFLNFTLVYNTGSAFSFLSDAGDWHRLFFTVFSSLMSVAIFVWIIRLGRNYSLSSQAFVATGQVFLLQGRAEILPISWQAFGVGGLGRSYGQFSSRRLFFGAGAGLPPFFCHVFAATGPGKLTANFLEGFVEFRG